MKKFKVFSDPADRSFFLLKERPVPERFLGEQVNFKARAIASQTEVWQGVIALFCKEIAMALVSIRGIHVEITQAMRDHAQSALQKLFDRHHVISHEVTVRALPKAEISISLSFQCAEGTLKVSKEFPATAFYSGMTEVVKLLSSKVAKSRGQMRSRHIGTEETPVGAHVDGGDLDDVADDYDDAA